MQGIEKKIEELERREKDLELHSKMHHLVILGLGN